VAFGTRLPGSEIQFSAAQLAELDALTEGRRTCTDCYTFECQACAQSLKSLGCPIGPLHGGFVWGRSNPNGTECQECAVRSMRSAKGEAAVLKACGATAGGESVETMVSFIIRQQPAAAHSMHQACRRAGVQACRDSISPRSHSGGACACVCVCDPQIPKACGI
jgi:hypothetical protein